MLNQGLSDTRVSMISGNNEFIDEGGSTFMKEAEVVDNGYETDNHPI